MSTSQLPRSRPSEQGVDARGVIALLEALAAESTIELHSLTVVRHGHVVVDSHVAPYAPDQPRLLYSLSKSFTSTLAGIAIGDGLLGLDDRVLDHLGELAPAERSERYERLTVRHALSMATGHEEDTIARAGAWCASHDDPEVMRAFFSIPPEREPGSLFCYNQLGTHTAARIVEARTGANLLDYAGERLFAPLGVAQAFWHQLNGHALGFSGLHVTPETIAKLGVLALSDGVWQGQRIVPAGWFAEATKVQIANDTAHRAPGDESPSDWQQGYGLQFWRSRHGVRGDGAYGQFMLLWPEEDAVVVTTSETQDMARLITVLTEHLVPALQGGGSAQADAALAERLAGLALPTPVDQGPGAAGTYEHLTSQVPEVTAVHVSEERGQRTLILDRGADAPLTVPLGTGAWLGAAWPVAGHRPVPLQTAAGFDGTRLEAQLRLVSTPHTLRLSAEVATGTAELTWSLPPLHGSSPDQHAFVTSGPGAWPAA